jgi:phage terminase large subunit
MNSAYNVNLYLKDNCIQDKNKLTNNNYRGKKVAMRSAYEQRLRLQQNKMKIQSNLNIKDIPFILFSLPNECLYFMSVSILLIFNNLMQYILCITVKRV